MQTATAAIPPCVPITPHEGVALCSWGSNPSFRGTLNIIWLCISTLGLCVWNAVHPDVPYPGTPKWQIVRKRVWWLFIGLFMPEILVLAALAQFRQAYTLLIWVDRETRVPTEFPWWMTVAEHLWATRLRLREVLPMRRASVLRRNYNAILQLDERTALLPVGPSQASLSGTPSPFSTDAMRGYVSEDQDSEGATRTRRKHPCPWTLTHSFYAVMHGFIGDAFYSTYTFEDGDRILTFDPAKGAQRINTLGCIPDISADDLNDRSKADFLAKGVLIWQFSVFIANCTARWAESLPLSLLEITTLSHSLCSLIALGLWWYKPHGVGEATLIDRTRSLSPEHEQSSAINQAFETVIPGPREAPLDIPRTVTILGIVVFYGLPHLLGLSVHFPAPAEQLYWQIATVTVICVPPIMCAILWILEYLPVRIHEAVAKKLVILIFGLVVCYAISSIYLMGESVRQVFALPEGSFHEPQLTRYLPSFS